ncbi:hypothetical protein HNY73_007505 [Argiope bruennichi]|uniref:Uncharacterized protein n=1 Tax=Argiope bruennichi TaxID=94029 RepID=A0A8T0FGQ5_ARGBR|nr:hypothetical protein HNY73_007505 [Argiope bruennichi]
MSLDSVQFLALAGWMMKDGKWRVRRLAFSPTVNSDETLVVVPTKESWGSFTYQDVETYCTVHPLNGFPLENCIGREFKVELDSMENFLRGQFYLIILKNPNTWDVKSGTFDMATFMFLQPIWKNKIVFLGERLKLETEVCRQFRVHKGRIIAFISFMEYTTHRIFHHEVKDWTLNGLHVDNFKRTVMECKRMNFFDPSIRWSRVAKKLKLSPIDEKKNSDQRLSFKLDNMLIVKQLFSFGLWTVSRGEGHVSQTSDAPMLIFHLKAISLQCHPKPSTVRRSFVEQDQYLYDRYVMHPNSIYVMPPETRYLILTVQKTLFAVDVMAWEDVRRLQDFCTHRQYTLPAYNLPPPMPKQQMQVPDMVRPEERRTRKRMRRNSPERAFIRPRDPEPVTFVQEPTLMSFVQEPTQDLVHEPESTQA